MMLGALIGIAGPALGIAAGHLAGRLVKPSRGGGFENLGAAVLAFLGTEIVVALVCLVTGVVLIVRGKRDWGAGLIVGWALGAFATGWAVGIR
jgi:hypothetical protein